MKEHAYFFGSRSVLVRENQKQFCSCSVLVLEQEQVREQVVEQMDIIFFLIYDKKNDKKIIRNIFDHNRLVKTIK